MSNIEIVDSLRSLYPLKDFEEEAVMEVVAEFRELKEKATAKMPVPIFNGFPGFCLCSEIACPHCTEKMSYLFKNNYCPNCGQHLDWSKGKE